MRQTFLALFVTLCGAWTLTAQDITTSDRDRAVGYLEKTRTMVIDATKGLSDRQLNFKQDTNRWSVAEVTEHIAAAEDFLMSLIKTNVMLAPGRTNAVDLKTLDELVLMAVPDRTTKFQAPEPLQPVNRFRTQAENLKHFQTGRDATLAYVKATRNLRAHAIDSPLGKQLDAYQWILFIAAHSERHTKQILEVKADPKFPKE